MYALDLPWLLLMLPLPWLLRRWLPGARQRRDALRLPFFHQLANQLGLVPAITAPSPDEGRLASLLDTLAWCLVVVALASPTRLEPPLVHQLPLRDLLLAVDVSQSMETRDAGSGRSRLEAVQQVLGDFLARREQDRLGLVAFGDRAYTQAGFTQDRTALRQLLEELQPGVAGPRTAIGDSIGLAIRLFANSQAQERVLILLSDGSDTASRKAPDEAARIARDQGIRIHCIGFGDPNGDAEQRLDTEQLSRVAVITGGRYLHANDRQQLAAAFAELDRLTPELHQRVLFQPRTALYHYPLAVAIALLLARLLSQLARRREVSP